MRSTTVLLRMIPLTVLAIVAVAGLNSGAYAESTAAKHPAAAESEVVVYYFHGTRRCNTCRAIESSAQQAVEAKFENELRSGAMQWKVVNTDEPGNEHFVKDFGLVSSSLVLVEMKGDEVVRHQVLQDVWTLIRDKPRFTDYVQGSIRDFLK